MDPQAGAVIAKRALQAAVALAGLVPVSAGILGAFDPAFLELAGPPQSLTHAAYLSGLLLGIGLAFWSTIPGIETKGGRFALLTLAIRLGSWGPPVTLPLGMELGVTPALWLWQRRLVS
jgi:hypothetical protein